MQLDVWSKPRKKTAIPFAIPAGHVPLTTPGRVTAEITEGYRMTHDTWVCILNGDLPGNDPIIVFVCFCCERSSDFGSRPLKIDPCLQVFDQIDLDLSWEAGTNGAFTAPGALQALRGQFRVPGSDLHSPPDADLQRKAD